MEFAMPENRKKNRNFAEEIGENRNFVHVFVYNLM